MVKRGHDIYKYLRGCHLEDRVDLFSVAPDSKTRPNGFKLQWERF